MRLIHLHASHFLSLHEVSVDLDAMNVFIGANASGKSNILNALRFLAEGLGSRDFEQAVVERGGIVHVAWKGEDADQIRLETLYRDGPRVFCWEVRLVRNERAFEVEERLHETPGDGPPTLLLEARAGQGWWWSAQHQIPLDLPPTGCALAAAENDASFPARGVAQFVRGWGFFDPSANSLRRASLLDDTQRLDATGRNLAGRLYRLHEDHPAAYERVIRAVRGVLGVPDDLQFCVLDADGRVYFTQSEQGLKFRVHQVGASSGTLRMLALMTALFGEAGYGLVGIEEPENHVHPAALAAFAQYLREASGNVQVLVTTHSPLLLDHLAVPEAVCVVRRTEDGTSIERESNPEAVRKALDESGFGLGEFYESKGFGR